MASRLPIAIVNGAVQQLQAADDLSAPLSVITPKIQNTSDIVFWRNGNQVMDVTNHGGAGELDYLRIGDPSISPLYPTLTKLLLIGAANDTVLELSGNVTSGVSGIADYTFINRGVDTGGTRIATLQVTTDGSKNVGRFAFAVKSLDADSGPTACMYLKSSQNLTLNTNGDETGITGPGSLKVTGQIMTGAPTGGTASAWKFGVAVTTSALTLKTTQYIQLDVDGTLVKLAVVN